MVNAPSAWQNDASNLRSISFLSSCNSAWEKERKRERERKVGKREKIRSDDHKTQKIILFVLLPVTQQC